MLTFKEYFKARQPMIQEDHGSPEMYDKFIDTLNRAKEALAASQADVSPDEIDEIIQYLQGEGDEGNAPDNQSPDMNGMGGAMGQNAQPPGPMPAT